MHAQYEKCHPETQFKNTGGPHANQQQNLQLSTKIRLSFKSKVPSECLVYNAVVNTSTTKNYYGTCEKRFTERYNNHTSSLRNKSCQKSTELSNHI